MVRRSPWDDLQQAGRTVEFRRVRLPDQFGGGVAIRRRGWWAVLLDDRLLGPERRSVLAHELVHVERDGGPGYDGQPSTWDAVVAKDEAAVEAEVARRLVPVDELEPWLRVQADVGELVTVEAVAAEFDVSLEVALRAMTLRACRPKSPPIREERG